MVVRRPKDVKKNIQFQHYETGRTVKSALVKKIRHSNMANRLANKSWNFINFKHQHASKGRPSRTNLTNRRPAYTGDVWVNLEEEEYED